MISFRVKLSKCYWQIEYNETVCFVSWQMKRGLELEIGFMCLEILFARLTPLCYWSALSDAELTLPA